MPEKKELTELQEMYHKLSVLMGIFTLSLALLNLGLAAIIIIELK